MRQNGGALPYLVQVRAVVCNCAVEPKEIGQSKSLENAIKRIEGYWSIYLTFFGSQIPWLRFEVIDVRDGAVMWRNGQKMKEEESGKIP